jgi:hypothetical protein
MNFRKLGKEAQARFMPPPVNSVTRIATAATKVCKTAASCINFMTQKLTEDKGS